MAKIGIIGAGAWGTALAITAHRAKNQVCLWDYKPTAIDQINATHTTPYFPAMTLPTDIVGEANLEKVVTESDVLLLVVAAQHTRSVLHQMKPFLRPETPLVLCAKGIELSTGSLLSEVAQDVIPDATLAVLSGPGFAAEVAKGNPTAVTIASEKEGLAEHLVQLLGSKSFRPYYSIDIIAPEVCGAIKNVIAIAAGIGEGCGYGDNGRAALITRGLNEMARFAKALGGHKTTVLGLSGVGDLILTACSTQSRNYSFGYAIGQTRSAKKVLEESTTTTEGVPTSAAVMKRAREMGIEMPICAAVEAILYNGLSVDDILTDLLSRPFKAETDAF